MSLFFTPRDRLGMGKFVFFSCLISWKTYNCSLFFQLQNIKYCLKKPLYFIYARNCCRSEKPQSSSFSLSVDIFWHNLFDVYVFEINNIWEDFFLKTLLCVRSVLEMHLYIYFSNIPLFVPVLLCFFWFYDFWSYWSIHVSGLWLWVVWWG